MREIDPKQTKRADAFETWMKASMPMVTLVKTLDITALMRYCRKNNLKFNMMMCWCIGKAAQDIEEFYMLPVGKKMMAFEKIAVSTVVANKKGGITTCHIPFSADLETFSKDYAEYTSNARNTCKSDDLSEEYMIIYTSAIVKTDFDAAINLYAGFFNNPFIIWGRYRKKFFKKLLPFSFQFHHTQMDGGHAAQFLENLQKLIKELC